MKCWSDANVHTERGKWLADDSSEHVRLEPPVVRVEPGRRCLVLEFETSEVQSTSAAGVTARMTQE